MPRWDPRAYVEAAEGWITAGKSYHARQCIEQSMLHDPENYYRMLRQVRVTTPRSRSWARLMRRIFEVDPLLCSQCQVEMRVVSVIQEVTVVDRLLSHLRTIGGNDPHEGTAQRGPPGGARASPDVDE